MYKNKEISRFCISGVLLFLLEYILVVSLSRLMPLGVANTLAFWITSVASYFVNQSYVFKSNEKSWKIVCCFFLLLFLGGMLNTFVTMICVPLTGLFVSKIMSTGTVMIYNYMTRSMLFHGRIKEVLLHG